MGTLECIANARMMLDYHLAHLKVSFRLDIEKMHFLLGAVPQELSQIGRWDFWLF